MTSSAQQSVQRRAAYGELYEFPHHPSSQRGLLPMRSMTASCTVVRRRHLRTVPNTTRYCCASSRSVPHACCNAKRLVGVVVAFLYREIYMPAPLQKLSMEQGALIFKQPTFGTRQLMRCFIFSRSGLSALETFSAKRGMGASLNLRTTQKVDTNRSCAKGAFNGWGSQEST